MHPTRESPYPGGSARRHGCPSRTLRNHHHPRRAVFPSHPEYRTACHGVKNVSRPARFVWAHASTYAPATSHAAVATAIHSKTAEAGGEPVGTGGPGLPVGAPAPEGSIRMSLDISASSSPGECRTCRQKRNVAAGTLRASEAVGSPIQADSAQPGARHAIGRTPFSASPSDVPLISARLLATTRTGQLLRRGSLPDRPNGSATLPRGSDPLRA